MAKTESKLETLQQKEEKQQVVKQIQQQQQPKQEVRPLVPVDKAPGSKS